MIERRSSSNIDDVIDDEEGAGDILRFSRVHWGRWIEARLDADSCAAVVDRHGAFDLAGGDHQSSDCIHKNRILLRSDKAQPLNGDVRSRSGHIKRNRSRVNTRELTVTRDGDCLRHQDHRWGVSRRSRGYRWGSVKREMPL